MIRLWRAALLLALLAAALPAGPVGAQEPPGELVPSFGDGMLVVAGRGFRPNERVTLTATIGGQSFRFTALAGPDGDFTLHTNHPVAPLQSVQLEARGDQGTGMAAMTSVPARVEPFRPIVTLPRAGDPGLPVLPLAAAALSLLVGGLALRGRVA